MIDKPIRILQVFTILNRGGAESMIMNYYRNIDRKKVQFDFLVHRVEKGAFDDEVISLGGEIYHVSPIKDFFNYIKSLNVFFEKHSKKYNIIHSHLNAQGAFVLSKAKEYKIPIRIGHSHIAAPSKGVKGIVKSFLRKKLKKNSTDFFSCGVDAGEWLFGKGEVFRIIPNAIDTDRFVFNKQTRNKYRKELGIYDEFVIGHVGRFNHQKNHDFIIEIFFEVVKKIPTSKLILVGEGDGVKEVIDKVNLLGLNDNVVFMGVRNDIPELLMMFDIFLFPSFYEGLPVTLVEAQSSGLKVFASDTITNEVSFNNEVNYISLKQTPKMWAKEILNSFPYERKNKKELIVENNYDIKSNAIDLQEFYLEKVMNFNLSNKR